MNTSARHSFAWLTAEGWREAMQSAAPDCHAAIYQWQQADWPATVRRQDADAGDDQCSLGIALPPCPHSGSKKRIGLRVARQCIARTSSPVMLSEAISAAPSAWKAELARLDRTAADAGLTLHVYGSLALQSLTRMEYLRPASDIDLLLAPQSKEQLSAGLALLLEAAHGLPIDGEIMFPGGEGVAWKEWHAAQAQPGMRVLIKHLHGVRLAHPAALVAELEGKQWAA